MTQVKVRRGQCIQLTWLDSSILGGWQYSGDLKAKPKEIESIGFICAVSPDAIAITEGRSETGGVIAPLTIPICCIKEYKIIDL